MKVLQDIRNNFITLRVNKKAGKNWFGPCFLNSDISHIFLDNGTLSISGMLGTRCSYSHHYLPVEKPDDLQISKYASRKKFAQWPHIGLYSTTVCKLRKAQDGTTIPATVTTHSIQGIK